MKTAEANGSERAQVQRSEPVGIDHPGITTSLRLAEMQARFGKNGTFRRPTRISGFH